MAKSQETSNKKEMEKKKLQKKKEKEQRKEERKSSAQGKSFEDMIAYVDEDGNISSTPPDPTKKKVIKEDDIVIGARKQDSEPEVTNIRKGKVTFFNSSKGFGFIKDQQSQDSIFVHIHAVSGGQIKENDTVTFETERGPKGLNAVRVKVI